MNFAPYTSALAAKVAAVNLANSEAVKLHKLLSPIFAPLVGCKILKADGTLLESVKKLLPELPNTVSLSVYRVSDSYLLVWAVKASVGYQSAREVGTGYHSAIYSETFCYVGEIENGNVLKALVSFERTLGGIRTDFTEAEVIEKRAVLEKAKRAVSEATGALYPFEEYDR